MYAGSLGIGAWVREDDTGRIISTVTNKNTGVQNIPSPVNRLNLGFPGASEYSTTLHMLGSLETGARERGDDTR